MINTTPEQMDETARAIGEHKGEIITAIEKMKAIVDGMVGNVWAGDAATAFQARFGEFYGKIGKCVDAAGAYQMAMTSAANAYREREAATVADANRFQ